MSGNCFLRQEATLEIITNVADFCSECYIPINEKSIIFYDMQNFRYLCQGCQEKYQLTLNDNGEPLTDNNSSLFN